MRFDGVERRGKDQGNTLSARSENDLADFQQDVRISLLENRIGGDIPPDLLINCCGKIHRYGIFPGK